MPTNHNRPQCLIAATLTTLVTIYTETMPTSSTGHIICGIIRDGDRRYRRSVIIPGSHNIIGLEWEGQHSLDSDSATAHNQRAGRRGNHVHAAVGLEVK
jgi:hypothetical protein